MKIYDDSNYRELIGDGQSIVVNGERRLLSAMPKPEGHDSRKYSKVFGAEVPTIPRSEWSARLKEQTAKKRRVSDFQKYAPDNQGSYPTCWAAGTCAAYSTTRVMQMGLANYVQLSAMSVACPISGGNSGGYEGDAVELLTERGGVPVELWGYTQRQPSLDKDPQVQAARLRHKALETYECDGADEFATAALLGFPCTVSYNWWSHVVMLCDLVEISANDWGFRIRNNWGDWEDSNEYGFSGYSVMRFGKGTPSGGFAFRQVTASEK